MVSKYVSIIIPTFRRSHIIKYTLDALLKQVYKDFEVLVILRPSNDGTERLLAKYQTCLRIRVLCRKKQAPVTDAYNIGLDNCKGEIIVFLDDDAVPEPHCILNHVKNYEDPRIGGVAGDVISAKPGSTEPLGFNSSQIIPTNKFALENIGRSLWDRPLPGLENHLVFLSRAGTVSYDSSLANFALHKKVRSLLGMGCNMSVLARAVKGIRFPNDFWVMGIASEQYLGWLIWKRGYTAVFDPEARVKHLVHGETMTRNILRSERDLLRHIENNLLFYKLYGLQNQLSIMHRISWIIFNLAVAIKKTCIDKETRQIIRIKSIIFSELLGLKWLISTRFGVHYSPKASLSKLIH